MAIYSLYIINKAGGLIYNRDFVAADGAVNRLTSNEYLVLAGTVHGYGFDFNFRCDSLASCRLWNLRSEWNFVTNFEEFGLDDS